MNNFIVSFTTTPYTLKNIPKMIDKLKNQTFQPTMIYVYTLFFYNKNIEYKFPDNWNFDDNSQM